ncbi:carboxymuconolactone decarboxylase family protein [Nocardia bovistercoris]|uniref:Carboxymuconolactone decarboxylase family protein n=1 Tax=Nocardia bovistercoris TaxID=2785916 RepID=A0A931IDM1_9NOCA|nr:carboxymuconolactone decarboxylase family protein [Nocardia bovistercoris]MBH0779727.1 carboxymuconolactone decarboxylase family protein [Nocardia bovistercoris]
MTRASPRLAPLPVEEWDERTREMMRGHLRAADRYLSGAPDAPPVPNVLGMLAHHGELASAWLGYNGLLLDRPTLDPHHRELVILRVARRCGSAYEWHQHVRAATRLGMSEERIDAVRCGAAAATWSPLEKSLLAATDQLLTDHRVDDSTWSVLARHLDNRQLLELLFVVGSYLCLALVFNSVDLQPDPDHPETPSQPETEERP